MNIKKIVVIALSWSPLVFGEPSSDRLQDLAELNQMVSQLTGENRIRQDVEKAIAESRETKGYLGQVQQFASELQGKQRVLENAIRRQETLVGLVRHHGMEVSQLSQRLMNVTGEAKESLTAELRAAEARKSEYQAGLAQAQNEVFRLIDGYRVAGAHIGESPVAHPELDEISELDEQIREARDYIAQHGTPQEIRSYYNLGMTRAQDIAAKKREIELRIKKERDSRIFGYTKSTVGGVVLLTGLVGLGVGVYLKVLKNRRDAAAVVKKKQARARAAKAEKQL